MTRELNFDHKNLNEITQEINELRGNKPYKIIETETGYQVLIPEDEDALDLYTEEIDALDDMVGDYLKVLKVEGEIGYDILGQTIWINIDGPDVGVFLKNRGDLLNDFQYVLEVFLSKKFPQVNVYVKCDADARRRSHIDDMLDMAQTKSKLALETGEKQKLPPMNAYERRVIHLSLLPVEGIATKSFGMGSLKQVLVIPVAPETEQSDSSEEASEAE